MPRLLFEALRDASIFRMSAPKVAPSNIEMVGQYRLGLGLQARR